MVKKLVLSIALIWGAAVAQNVTTTSESGVIYNTGNLVNNTATATDVTTTWQNIGLWNQGLPCWGPGGPVYCGPLPYFNNGSLNYSYGTADVNQTVNINAALATAGTGLRVNGYNFGFTAKNGNGWDDGRLDYLTAYVRFTNPGNKIVYDKSYDLNQQFNWTTFNFSETFATPFAAKDLGTVTYGIVGRDNNFWAGPYGPEVQGINFSLKYSVDPCSINPLYSPTCTGYLDALAKLIPASTVTTDPVSSLSASPTSTNTIVIDPAASTVTTTSTVTADVPRKVNESSVTAVEKKQEDNTSAALNLIKKNQERDNTALGVAQTAIATANQAAQASQQEAAAIAAGAVANSVAVNAVNTGSQQSLGTGIRATATVSNMAAATTGTFTGPGSVAISMLQPPTQTQPQATSTSTSVFEPAPAPAPIANNNSSSASTPQSYAVLPPNFLTDRTNPLTDIVEGRQGVPVNTAPVATGPVVNTNAGDNDAAGGVSINRMALAPTGYGDYLNFALKDAAFYAPREVYKNQRTVDNARALRQLSSDVRHREMVEQQYRR